MYTEDHSCQNELAKFHFQIYRSLTRRQDFNMHILQVSDHNLSILERSYIYYVRVILEELSKDERRILVRDFIETSDRNWWMDYYSKSTYYRLKNEAIKHFLDCLHSLKMV